MACSEFNPDLPYGSATEKVAYIQKFLNNLSDDCGPHGCDNVCATNPDTDECFLCITRAVLQRCPSDKASTECKACLQSTLSNASFDGLVGCVSGPPSGSLSSAAIAGIVVGVLVAVIAIMVFVWWWRRRKLKVPSEHKAQARDILKRFQNDAKSLRTAK